MTNIMKDKNENFIYADGPNREFDYGKIDLNLRKEVIVSFLKASLSINGT